LSLETARTKRAEFAWSYGGVQILARFALRLLLSLLGPAKGKAPIKGDRLPE
jgi:hypothetical protein